MSAERKIYVIDPPIVRQPIALTHDQDISTYNIGDRVFVAPLFDYTRSSPATPAIVIGAPGTSGRMFLSLGIEPYSFPAKEFKKGHVEHAGENILSGTRSIFELLEKEVKTEGIVRRLNF